MTFTDLISRYRARSGVFADKLARAAGTAWKVLAFNLLEGVVIQKRYLCVMPGRSHVSIIYGTRFLNRPRIKGFKRYFFDGQGYIGPRHLADAVRLAMDELSARGSGIVLALPKEWAVVRTVELPAVVRENIRSVMEYELDRLTPFNPSEALYDFAVNGEQSGQLGLTLIAMREETVRPYLEALKEKGLVPERITIGLAAFGALCRLFGNGGELVCISVTDDGYEGCFMEEGALLSCFSGDLYGSGPEERIEQIRQELAPIVSRLAQDGVVPLVYMAAPAGCVVPEDALGVPVRVLNREDIRVMFGADIEDDAIGALGGLVEMIGPAARGFDLRKRGGGESRKTPLVSTAVLGALVLAAMVPYVVSPLEMEKRRLEAIEYNIKIRKGEVRKVEALRKEVDSLNEEVVKIRKFKGSRPMALSIIKELTTVLPKTVWLTRSRITGETVEIEGYARLATEVLPKLEESGLFKKVEFTSPTVRDTRRNAERFVIKMEIEDLGKKE